MHEHHGFHTRQNHTQFLGENTISDRHNLTSRSLSILESQKGNAQELNLDLPRNLERFSSISFDLLGGQEQLMRAQQSDMPQCQSRQQSGFNDLQLWQQHLMFKQLQELQRQQLLQQLDQEARQHNPMNQLSAIANQTAGGQLPATVNGMPIRDASNYFWQGDLMGGDSQVPSTSQMFMIGNMNWAQCGGSPTVQGIPNGFTFSHDQRQLSHSLGLVPQQLNQSLYGAPIASTRGSLNQPHLQGISHDHVDMLTKAGGSQVEKALMHSSATNNSFHGDQNGTLVSMQGFQGKNLFEHAPIQGLDTGVLSVNFHEVTSLPRNSPIQEFHVRQEQGGWSGGLQEKAATLVGPSQGLVGLDPMAEKILFNTDDKFWDASFGRSGVMGTGGCGNSLEGTDYLNTFPSVQSGSWSALMQSAVAEASSGDTGLQDEWSGLSYQKTELSTGNQPTTLSDGGKQQTNWVDNNLQSASSLTSRTFPLLDDTNMSLNSRSIHGIRQPSLNVLFEQSGRVQPDASHEPIHQSPKEVSKWLDCSLQQKPSVNGSRQIQPSMTIENVSEGSWAGQSYDQSESASHFADTGLNAQNMQGSCVHPQSTSSYIIGSASLNKPNDWNINESLSPGGDAVLKICEKDNTSQPSHSNERGMHMERDHDGCMWKNDGNHVTDSFPNLTDGLEQLKSVTGSPQVNREEPHMGSFTALPNSSASKTNQEMTEYPPNIHNLDYGKHVVDSFAKNRDKSVGKYQNHLKCPPVLESSMNNSERDSGEKYSKRLENCQKEILNYSNNSNQLHSILGEREGQNLLSSASDYRAMASGNQKSGGQVGQKASGPHRFQHHPMGNLEGNVDPADTTKHVTHSQPLPPQVVCGSKSREQKYFRHSKFIGHAPDKGINMEKRHLDFQANVEHSAEEPFRGVVPGYASSVSGSFDGSDGIFAPNKLPDQTSQNMLELLHKVDQASEYNTVKHFGSSDRKPSSEMPEPDASDTSVAHFRHNQFSSPQGFGLRLAPPSQRLPVSNPAFSFQNSSQTVNNINSRNVDSEVGRKGQTWLVPTFSMESFPREISRREHHDNNFSVSGHMGSESSHLNLQGSSSSALLFPRNQLQHHLMFSTSGQLKTDQSVSVSFDRRPSHFRTTDESLNVVVADQSSRALFPGAFSRIPSFNLGPSTDTSQLISTNRSHLRGPSQQLPVLESSPVSQPSVISGISQQGAFSTMLHNVRTNVSTQQCIAGGTPNDVPSNLVQSTNASNNNLETTSLVTQKRDGQVIRKGGNGPSEFGTCSFNSQHFSYQEEQPGKEISWQSMPSEKVTLVPHKSGGSQGQESATKHLSDSNTVASGSFAARTHQQELDRRRYGKEPALVSQTEHVKNSATSNIDIEAFRHSLKPSHVLHQNYSLLRQVESMKGAEIDPNKRDGKRFKGADGDPDAQQQASKAGHQLVYGCSTMVRDSVENELNPAARHISFSSRDSEMPSFSSEVRENQYTNAFSQHVLGLSSQNVTFGENISHIHSSHPSTTAENTQVSPQMAASWFEQYGTFKNGQLMPMYDALKAAKTASQQFVLGKAFESTHAHTSTEQINAGDASQVGKVQQSTTTALVVSEPFSAPHSLPSEVTDERLAIMGPKKRKNATSELLPWRKEVTHGSQRLQNKSTAEQDWAQAANRLIEKVEDEGEMLEDGQQMLQPRRRLVLTTQLMQQLLCPTPAILSTDATSDYESVIYFVSKLALVDACGLITCSGSDLHVPHDSENTTFAKLKNSERLGDQYLSEVAEDFIGRARKLESALLRLDKRAWILDVRVECQDLERVSIINRFAKFKFRGYVDGAETSPSGTASNAQEACPQRYVTVLPMPRNLPEGVRCLTLATD